MTTLHWNNIFNQIPKGFIIGGDFNCHHLGWGCVTTERDGQSLIDAINDNCLCLLNDGSPTRLSNPQQNKSAVDLTICSAALSSKFDWRTLNNTLGSDHFLILIKFNENIKTKIFIEPSRKWNTKKANWLLYHSLTASLSEHCTTEQLSSQSIEEKYNKLINIINQAAEISIPKTQRRCISVFRHRPWFDSECKTHSKATADSIKKYKNVSNWNNYLDCKRNIASTRKLFNSKKRNSWKDYCNSLNKDTNISDVWKKIKILNNSFCAQCKFPPSSNNWTNEFLNNLTPPSCCENLEPVHNINVPYSSITAPFSMKELHNALKNTNNSAPGLDDIQYSMLDNMASSAKTLLLNILNHAWIYGTSIPQWSTQVVIPIRKKDKDPNIAKSYRPIALSSCVCKTFERLVKTRLDWWLESNNILPSYQHGYRRGHSALDNIGKLIVDIGISNSSNRYLTGLFLDLEGAYDHVSISILQEKMLTLGLPYQFVRPIIELIKTRKIFVRFGSKLVGPRTTNIGLPQGSVLSPTLFNIYTYDLQYLFKPNIKIIQFADDLCIYSSEKKLLDTRYELNIAVKQLNKWNVDNGFQLSSEKTVATVFTRHRIKDIPNHILLDGTHYKISAVVKFLGIYLDSKLSWNKHISHLIKKCEQRINILRSVTHTSWGADPKTALMLYKNFILSILDYGSIFFGDASESCLIRLERLQLKAIKSSLGALHSTPTNVLYSESNIMPLSFRRKILSAKFVCHRLQFSNHISIANYCSEVLSSAYWKNKNLPLIVQSFLQITDISPITNLHAIPCYLFPYEYSLSNNFFLPNLNLQTHSGAQNSANLNIVQKIKSKWPNAYHIYTDASKNINGVGCAYLDPQLDFHRTFQLPQNMFIYSAEMLAIKLSLIYLKNHTHNEFIIFCDSKSVIQKLSYPKFNKNNTCLIYEIIDLILNLDNMGKSVKICWIKGHSNFEHNNKVDILAREAVTNGFPIEFPLNSNEINYIIKNSIWNSWNIKYKETIKVKGSFYGYIQPSLPRTHWFSSNLSRSFITMMVRLRSNHNFCPYHLHRIHMRSNEQCPCDNTSVGDVNHLLFSCPLYANNRHIFLNNLLKLNIQFPINIQTLLANHSLPILRNIHEYIVKENIKI